jgi:hypothetical protein
MAHGVALQKGVDAAREILAKAARKYNGVVFYSNLAALIEAKVGVTGYGHEIGMHATLLKLAEDCIDRSEPVLSALCVNDDGTVAGGYARSVLQDLVDVDHQAAAERLRCYRHFNAVDLPADGGSPALPEDLVEQRPTPMQVAERTANLSVAQAALLIKNANGAADRWKAILRLLREADAFKGPVAEKLDQEPDLTGDSQSDVALAAAAELIAMRRGQAAPPWTRASSRFLGAGRWVGNPDPQTRAKALIWTPPSFRRRGLLVASSELRLSTTKRVSNGPWTPTETRALLYLYLRLRHIGIVAQVYAFDADAIAVVACRAEAAVPTLTKRNVASVFCDSRKVASLVADVTRNLNLPDGWLNHRATQYCRRNPSGDAEYSVDHPYLQVSSSTLENVLALKVLAAQHLDDAEEIAVLADKLKLPSAEQMWQLVSKFYPGVRILPESRVIAGSAFSRGPFSKHQPGIPTKAANAQSAQDSRRPPIGFGPATCTNLDCEWAGYQHGGQRS